MEKKLKDKEKKRFKEIFMIMKIFPQDRWMEKLVEYACMNNDTELIRDIGKADQLLKRGSLNV